MVVVAPEMKFMSLRIRPVPKGCLWWRGLGSSSESSSEDEDGILCCWV